MKISKIYIKGFQQFQDVELDFTNPKTGLPLDKVCFIGSNGTGKSKLLRLINWLFMIVFTNFIKSGFGQPNLVEGAKIIFKISHKNSNYLIFHFNRNSFILRIENLIKSEEDTLINDLLSLKSTEDFTKDEKYRTYTASTLNTEFLAEFTLQDNAKDLLIYSQDETQKMYIMGDEGVPVTSVDDALNLSKNYPFYAEVSPDKINIFWKLLIYNLRKREEERDAFEKLPESRKKVKDILIHEFDLANPKILERLAILWDRILNKAGLEFDFEGA
ncbi:MAG: ATP-binding protein, partial [Ignavibacteria bacterium]|nr:ATP-binding protein [Ignavibacteria bacterium]